jgi:rod shape-determining protein MreC
LQSAHIVHVVLKHFDVDGHYFLINSGAQHHVEVNMVAVINNHLVGRVSEVYPAYAKIQLLTDKALKVAACCSQTKAYGIFTGTGQKKQAALNFVDHLQDVVMGDLVLSSGTGLLYPAGLCLGNIVYCVKKDVAYDIVVQPLIDLEHLDYCFLLPPIIVPTEQSAKPIEPVVRAAAA